MALVRNILWQFGKSRSEKISRWCWRSMLRKGEPEVRLHMASFGTVTCSITDEQSTISNRQETAVVPFQELPREYIHNGLHHD